jgi:hypothetical protein
MGRPPAYPWEEWMDGQIHTVEYGKDFTCQPNSLINQLYVKSRQESLKVKISPYGMKVTFQFYKVADNHEEE